MTVHKLSLSSATLTHLFILYVLLLVDFEFKTIFGHGKAFFLCLFVILVVFLTLWQDSYFHALGLVNVAI